MRLCSFIVPDLSTLHYLTTCYDHHCHYLDASSTSQYNDQDWYCDHLPSVGQPHQILMHNLFFVAVKLVREVFEHVTYSGAGHSCHGPSTHPHPPCQLYILSSPNVQTVIEQADTIEVLFTHSKGTSNQSRGCKWKSVLTDHLRLMIRYT